MPYSDLDRLAIAVDVREMLVDAGFSTIQRLIEADDEALANVSGIEERDVASVREAIEKFLRGGVGAQRESFR